MNSAFQSLAPRSAQRQRRSDRQLLARGPGRPGAGRGRGGPPPKPLTVTEVDAFLAIDARGRVTLYSGKVDMGTGVRTALAQICADELDVPFRSVTVVEGDTALTPDQGKTWGSLTIQLGGVQIRNAAATARAALARAGGEAARRQAGGTAHVRRRDPRRQPARQLWRADRRPKVRAQARPCQADQIQGSEGLHDRRQVGAAGRHPGQGERALHLHHRLPRARHAARPRGAAAVGRRQARKRRRGIDQAHSRRRARGARGQFPRRGRAQRMGRDQGCTRAQGHLVEMGGAAGAGKALRACAGEQGVPRRDHRQCRRHRQGHGRGGRAEIRRHLRLRHPHPRLAGPVLRGCRIPRRQAHLVVGIAGHPRPAQAARGNVRDAGGQRPLHLFRRLRLLRPQRPRGRRGRRRHARQGGGPAGAGAVVARRRARLGPERPADADRSARSDGRFRHRDRLGVGVLRAAADRQELHGAAGAGDARGPAGESRRRARQHFPELQHPLQVRQHQSGLPSAGDHAVPAVLDQDAGPDAEHLCQRMLP